MNRKRQRLVAGILLFIMMIVTVPAIASEIDDLRNQQKLINNEIENLKNNIKEVDKNAKNVAQEIVELDQKLSEAQKELAATEAKLKETQQKLENTKEELKQAEERVKEQQDDLNVRLKTMYKTGPVDYIEVLLGSSSFSDFLTRLDIVKRIIEADKNLLAEFRLRQEEVAQKRQNLKNRKDK